jgi:hypothetical protein
MREQESRDASRKQTSRRLERAGICVAVCGVTMLAAGGFYDMQSFRSSPTVPDATHRILQESHGIARYKTSEQIGTLHFLNIAGASTFAVGAAFLFIYRRSEKRHA